MNRTSSISETSWFNSVRDNQELDSLSYDYLAKVILLGPSGCGKSSLLNRFTRGEFRSVMSQTVGVEFTSKIVKLAPSTSSYKTPYSSSLDRRKKMKLQLWDTAGQERFRAITRSYYRGSAAVLLVVDSTDKQSLKEIELFITDVLNLTNPTISILLVANKYDAIDNNPSSTSNISSTNTHNNNNSTLNKQSSNITSPITQSDIQNFTNRHPKIPVLFTSALNGKNVEEAFNKIASMIVTKIELGLLDPDDIGSGVQYGDGPRWDETISIASTVKKRNFCC